MPCGRESLCHCHWSCDYCKSTNTLTLHNDQYHMLKWRETGFGSDLATLEAWTLPPKNDDSALPAGLKPLLHNIHSPTIPDWQLRTGAESGDFGCTRVSPPRGQRAAFSMYGGAWSCYPRCLRMSNERCVLRRADVVLAVRSSSCSLR